MIKRNTSRIALGLGLAALSLSAAQALEFKKPEDAIKYRQSTLAVMGAHFSSVGAVVKGEKAFNAQDVAADIAVVASLASLPWQAFGPGTEGGKAKPEIWKEGDKVKAGIEKFQTAVVALNDAGKSGNLDAIKKAFGNTAQSCKGCHDNYRKK